jgi:hypothetical protein
MSPNEVLRNTTPVSVHQSKAELGSRVALFGSALVPSGGLFEVLRSANTDIVGEREFVLGLSIASLGFHAQCIDTVLRIACGGPDELG